MTQKERIEELRLLIKMAQANEMLHEYMTRTGDYCFYENWLKNEKMIEEGFAIALKSAAEDKPAKVKNINDEIEEELMREVVNC